MAPPSNSSDEPSTGAAADQGQLIDPKSVHTTPNNLQGRRGFLAALGGVSLVWLGSLLYPVYRYLSPPANSDPLSKNAKTKVDKVTAADVALPGQGKNGGYAGRGLIVLRTNEGQLRAFDAKCTHAGCNVSFAGDKMSCPCHGGTYDLAGKNIAGPPPRPLAELDVFEENGELFVGRRQSERMG
jgi:cytochrome b6-f complex iron-sulfur subunit